MISEKFRTPLSTTLMLLDSLLNSENLTQTAKDTIGLVISQINLLFCLINDILDLQLINNGHFMILQG